MIRINLIRQLPSSSPSARFPRLGWVAGVVCLLLVGMASGWWTQELQNERDRLVLEKTVAARNLSGSRETLERLSQVKAQSDGMMASLRELEKAIPTGGNHAEVMEVVGQSLQNLQIWLDALQIEGKTLEIQGQAYLMGDVGVCLDRLEQSLPLGDLPFVEIQEGTTEPAAPYSFIIRLSLEDKTVT